MMDVKIRQQKGLTLISLIFVLGIFAFFVLLILKVGPIYLDHSKVKSALAAVEETPGVETLGESEVRTSLDKRFGMNYVNHVGAKDAKIVKHGNYLKVNLDYEVVEKIFGNLSVLVEFHDGFEAGKE